MELLNFFSKNKVSVLSALLMVLACAFGADASMAMADAATEEAAAKTNLGDALIADDKGINTQLPGTVASGTQLNEGELTDPDMDMMIAEFYSYKFTLETDLRRKAQQKEVSSYEVRHYRHGSSVLDFAIKTGATTTTAAASVDLTLTGYFTKDAFASLAENQLLYFPTLPAYAEDGTTSVGNGAILYIVGKDKTKITVESLNGAISSGEMQVPAIAAGTPFSILSNALAESQMHCDPENYQPRPVDVYLQKHACNIVITDYWKEINKKYPFVEADIREDALYKFRKKRERNLWVGQQTRIKRAQSANMGDEYVYTSRGVLNQINKKYAYGEKLEFSDLIRLTKMQFTDYAASNEAEAYCGKNFMEKLLNIDYTQHKDISFEAKTVMGIDISAFKTTFGTLNFKYTPSLDDIGYEDYCVVLDMSKAVHYKKAKKNYNIDMKEGAGENREAKRDIHIEIDALALKGYNSILVGPADGLYNKAPNATITFTSIANGTLPQTPVAGTVYYVTTSAAGNWPVGSVIEYVDGAWHEYEGDFEA